MAKLSDVNQVLGLVSHEIEEFARAEKNFLSEITAANTRYVNALNEDYPNVEIEITLSRFWNRFSDKELEHFCQILAICTNNTNHEQMRLLYLLIREKIKLNGNILQRYLPRDILQLKLFLLDKYYKQPQQLLDRIRDGLVERESGKHWDLFDLIRLHYPAIVLCYNRRRPKQRVWRKGYNDHGSLGKDHPDSGIIFNLELKQLEKLEEIRKVLSQTLNFLWGGTE